jgi:maltose alpha-D-glucosyltransferase / alpha-amylase
LRFEYLQEFRDFLSWQRGEAILLAEVNVTMDKIAKFFRNGKMHMLFN